MQMMDICTPELPESNLSATVSRIYVSEGERVVADQILLDIETDKVVLEVVAPYDGTIQGVEVTLGQELLPQQRVCQLVDITDTLPSQTEANIHSTVSDEVDQPQSNVSTLIIPVFLVFAILALFVLL